MSDELPPIPPPLKTGEHVATHEEVQRWGWAHLAAAAVGAVGGTGAIVVFLVGYAERVEARAHDTARDEVTIVSQRLDVVKGDMDTMKLQVAVLDAGIAGKVERLEKKIDASNVRNEERYDRIETMQRQMLLEIKKGK